MPCCHDNHNTVIELAMQRRAAFSWAGQKAMRSLGSSSLRSRDALHLSSILCSLLTLGAHAPEGYGSCPVCVSVRNLNLGTGASRGLNEGTSE